MCAGHWCSWAPADMGVLRQPLCCRCRYLEETGCASICINSCKLPTQEFFARDMGLPLTMVRAVRRSSIIWPHAACR